MKRPKRSRIDVAQVRSMAQALRWAVLNALLHSSDAGANERALRVEPAAQPIAPALLATAHAEETRPSMCALYELCLEHYRRFIAKTPSADHRDDIRTAVAHFVAANMQALHRVEVTPTMLQRLHGQLATVARLSSHWDRASLRDRQLFFEKMAIVAVLVDQMWTRAAAQGPAAIEHVQRGARGYLRELLGFEPDRLTLSESGLGIAPASRG